MAKSYLQEVEPRAVKSLRFIDEYLVSRKPTDDMHRNARLSVSLGNLYIGEHRNKIKDEGQKFEMKRKSAPRPKKTRKAA